jgi:hypothetical protein
MHIKVKYGREEVGKIVLEQHIKRFGEAPEGEYWDCSVDYYDGCRIENVKVTEPDKEV